jgi:3-dehydroquinate dehydratase type I
MIKYCLPVIKENKEDILNEISQNPEYSYYEIWLAYIKDLDTDFVWKLSEQFKGKLIFVFRKQNLEKSEIEKELREKIIKLLENSENLMDFDINDGSWGLDYIHENKLGNKVIASYHNYKETPENKTLEKLINEMETYKPEIYKFSTLCNTREDSLKLLTLLLKLKKDKKKFLVFGMGELGKIVRIYGALWGNEFNFAPAEESGKSAPGQLVKTKLENILGLLKEEPSVQDTRNKQYLNIK